MKTYLLFVTALVFGALIEKACADELDLTNLAKGVVCLDQQGKRSCTAWVFQSSSYLVTVWSAAKRFELSVTNWTEMRLRQELRNNTIDSRTVGIKLLGIAGDTNAIESLVMLVLREPLSNVICLNPLIGLEIGSGPASCIAYVDGKLHYAKGNYKGTSKGDFGSYHVNGFMLCELCEGNNRSVLDSAEGSPIFNDSGQVIGIIGIFLANENADVNLPIFDGIRLQTRPIRVSYSWGYPNIAAISPSSLFWVSFPR